VIPVACVAITAVALYYIFHIPERLVAGPEKTRVIFLRERKEAVYENLRDLNFEYKAGKLPDRDYQTMKNSLEDEAAGILAEIAQIESGELPLAGSKKGQPG
jgi:hypothetical protein